MKSKSHSCFEMSGVKLFFCICELNFIIHSFVIDVNSFSNFLLPEEQTANTCRNLSRLFLTIYRNIPAQDGSHCKRYVFRYWNIPKSLGILFEIPLKDVNFQIDSKRDKTILQELKGSCQMKPLCHKLHLLLL